METRFVEKPWGHEFIFAVTEKYVGKILFIRKDEALSLQFHEKKDETIYVQKGRILFSWSPNKTQPLKDVVLKKGTSFRIPPGMIHRMTAQEDTEILEVSTPELDDVVRLEDRYGRAR